MFVCALLSTIYTREQQNVSWQHSQFFPQSIQNFFMWRTNWKVIQLFGKPRCMALHWSNTKFDATSLHIKFWVKIASSNSNNSLKLYRALCCLYETCQEAYCDVDANNLYTPVVRHSTTRMFILKTAAQQLTVEGAEVDSAYLYCNIDRPLVMMQPTNGSKTQGFPGKFCLVTKSLHGALQVGEMWASLVHITVLKWNFC